MLNHTLNNQKGFALLITLSIITIFLAVSMEVNRRVRKNIQLSGIDKTQARLMDTAQSGLTIAKAVLLQDAAKTASDSVQETWADPEKLEAIITSVGLNSDELELKITDEMGKIQVNALLKSFPGREVNTDQKKIWENLLSFFISKDKSQDDRDPGAILNSLIDWLDSGDDDAVSGISGAESDYYQSLDPPYSCANRPLYDLGELFMIKGITTDLLQKADGLGSLISDPEAGTAEFQVEDLFTVFGVESTRPSGKQMGQKNDSYPGKININTAPVPVLAAILPFGKQDFAEKIAEFRSHRQDTDGAFTNNLDIKDWYVTVAGLTQEEKTQMDLLIGYSSHIFSIESRASAHGQSLVLKNVVVRRKSSDGKWECQTLRQMIESPHD